MGCQILHFLLPKEETCTLILVMVKHSSQDGKVAEPIDVSGECTAEQSSDFSAASGAEKALVNAVNPSMTEPYLQPNGQPQWWKIRMKRPQRVEAIKVFGIDAESLKNIRISFYGAELKDLGGRSPRRKERKVEGKHELLVAENFSGAHRDFIVYCLPPIEGVRAIEIRKFPPYNENYKLSLRRVQVLATNLEEIDKDLDRKLEELNMTEKKIEAVVESHFKLLDKDSDNRLRKEEVQRVMAEVEYHMLNRLPVKS